MKTAIKNGKIVTYNNGISVQENQSIIIENNIITNNFAHPMAGGIMSSVNEESNPIFKGNHS